MDLLGTDGAMSPLVRPDHNISPTPSRKRKLSMSESRATSAGPAKRQQTLTTHYQSTKSGSHLDHHHHHHEGSRNPVEDSLQKARAANRSHSGSRPAGETKTLCGHQSEQQRRDEARKRLAAAAKERQKQRIADEKKQMAAARPRLVVNQARQDKVAAARQPLEDYRVEQEAWDDRDTAAIRISPFRTSPSATYRSAAAVNPRPTEHTILPTTPSVRQQPSAPAKTRPRPTAKKQPPSILSQLSADAKRAKERKACELKARNERMRAATDEITESQAQQEAEANHALSKARPYEPLRAKNTVRKSGEDDDGRPQPDPDDELVLEPSPQPQGPFSLNSAAGIRAIRKTIPRPINLPYDDVPTKSTAQRFKESATPKISFKKTAKNQDRLLITADDLRLYQWRQQGVHWSDVRQFYSELTGTAKRSEDSLRTRFRQVENAIETEEITQELCDQVLLGDREAEAELNRLAGLRAGLPDPATNLTGLDTVPFRKILKQTPAPRSVTLPPATAHRPTQGGKTLDHDTYVVLLNQHAEANATDDDTEDETSRDGSPPNEADCVFFLYFMVRRDLVSDDIDNDYETLDEEEPWREYDAAFYNVGYANVEASKFVWTVPEGTTAIFDPAGIWALTHEPLGEGMSAYELRTKRGLVQVQVRRRLMTWQEHMMPRSKEGWTSKTVYGVRVRKRKKAAAGDLFEEASETEHYQLHKAVYGSLDQANHEAVEEWLKLTLKATSTRLHEFECRKEEARTNLRRRLEDAGEGKLFEESMEDDEMTVKIHVEPVKLFGARN